MKRKIIISLAGILMATNVALAEENGWFVGGQVGYGEYQEKRTSTASPNTNARGSRGDFNFGLLGGYKQFFTNEFGIRYYGVFGYTTYKGRKDIPSFTLNANADLLYNFVKFSIYEFGIFGGLSLGYQHYDIKQLQSTAKGFDVGINLGARVIFIDRHNIEIYSRFGLNDVTTQNKDAAYNLNTDHAIRQPYLVGLRYTYSF